MEKPNIIQYEDLQSGTAKKGDLLLFLGGCPRYPGDHCALTNGYSGVIVEVAGELYYEITGTPDEGLRYAEKAALFSMRYGSSSDELLAELQTFEENRTRWTTWWERVRAWWRYDFAQTHHKGCGGVLIEAGTSGLSVLRVHFVCSKCHEETYITHSPGD